MDLTLRSLLVEETRLKQIGGELAEHERVIKAIEEIDPETNLAAIAHSSLCVLTEDAAQLLNQELILEELLAKDVVALVVYQTHLPENFLRKAKICKIPIISAAEIQDKNWLNELKRNMELSAISLMEHNIRMQQTFQDILLEDGGFKTICTQLSKLINNPVLVLDRFKEDIIYLDGALRGDREKYYQMEERKLVNIKEVYNRYSYQINRVIYAFKDTEEHELHLKIGKSKDTLAYLVIVENKEIFREQDFIAIIQAANTLALKLNFNRFVQTLARKTCNELIKELLEGKTLDRETLIKRGELAGWDLTIPYQLYIFGFKDYYQFHDDEEGDGAFFLFDYQEKVIRFLHRVMKSRFPYRYIIFDYQDDILLLVNIHTDDLEIQRRKVLQVVSEELEKKFKKLEFKVGGGRYYHNCLDIRNSYQEGMKALTVLRNGSFPQRNLFFEDIGILQILWDVDRSNLVNFTTEMLKGLIEYDKEGQTDLINTLGAFLSSDGRIQETADKLHVHPNTISYRIKRIGEILGCDLKDFETKLNLSIAYKIYRYIYAQGENSSA